MNRFFLLALFPLLLAACGGSSTDSSKDDSDDTGTYVIEREALTDGGSWRVSYEPIPDPIPPTDNFELLLTVSDPGTEAGVTGAEVGVVAGMPEHNHFMNTTAVVTEIGDGSYGVTGMQFHMSGHWRIDVTVASEGVSETAVFHTECCE